MAHSRISPAEAANLMRQGYFYLDVRSPEEFGLGHPEGAFNVPWLDPQSGSPNARFLEVVCAAFDKAQGIIVGCQTGRRSVPATEQLLQAGFVNTVEQRAGFAGRKDAFGGLLEPGWQRSGLPVSYEPAPGRAYRALCEGGIDNSADSER